MAHTYTNLQPSLSAILKEVVQSTSDAIAGEIGYTVKYRHNGFKELLKELAEASQVNSTRNDRYPLIALIQPFRFETNGTASGIDVKPDILILMDTDPHKTSDERELESYDAILRPTHAEFISQLKKHPLVYFKGVQPQSSGMDIYHLGDERGGKVGYELPDYLDAILIEGLDLHIHAEQSCLQISTGQSPIHEILLKDSIKEVSIQTGTNQIALTVDTVDYVNSDPLADAPVYELKWSYLGATNEINIGVPLVYNISSVPDGVYIGVITSSYGATYQFEYYVRTVGPNKTIASYTHLLSQVFTEDLALQYYFNYPTTIAWDFYSSLALVNSLQVQTQDGTVIHEILPAAQTGTDDHIEPITALLNSYTIILTTSNSNQLENKTILNLKTI